MPKKISAIHADMVIYSFKIFSIFREEFDNFKREKKCNFARMDKLEQDLYNLKNATHTMFRKNISENREVEEADLFDLIISSIFHEMLHLKEYIYILDRYEPSYMLLEKRFEDKKLDDFKKDFLKHSREIVGEAKLGLPLKMQGVKELVDDAIPHLEQIIKKNSFDNQLIRTLYVSADLINNVYHEKGIEHL